MNPLSGTVLVAAAVVASPAAWRWLVLGTMPMEIALWRYLVALVACWAGLSLVARLLPSPGRSPRTDPVTPGAPTTPAAPRDPDG